MNKFFRLAMRCAFAVIATMCAAAAFAVEPSGTLPVIYINTEDGMEITSTEDYLTATLYVDANGVEGYENIGSADAPISLQIKGRGNYTWTSFDKKPYRLKLASKTALLGLKKNKHFALLAHADDELAFLRNTVGFEISRRVGLEYTPAQQPCELVLNGDYRGLYLLTEHIRVEADRVNVIEQADYETLAENITGGWLVEIDNYDEAEQIKITDGNGEVMRFTYKSPELLSEEQAAYLRNLVETANTAIFDIDKTSTKWQDYIDIDELAKFYIVQEVLDNCESFHGSCYWHKERGENTKIKFGPVWDFGNAFRRSSMAFVYSNPPFHQHWIGEVAKYPAFQEAVKRHWEAFVATSGTLDAFVNEFISKISEAASSDFERWPTYGNWDVDASKNKFLNKMRNKIFWLDSQWRGTEVPQAYYICGASSVLGGWMPGSAPMFGYDYATGIYSHDLDYVDRLTSGFKILGQQSWGGIEYGSNGSYIDLNADYELGITTNGDIKFQSTESLSNITVTLREVADKIVIKIAQKESGLDENFAHDGEITLATSAGVLYVTTPKRADVAVYSLEGRCWFAQSVEGNASVALPAGIYIVKSGGSSAKVAVP